MMDPTLKQIITELVTTSAMLSQANDQCRQAVARIAELEAENARLREDASKKALTHER